MNALTTNNLPTVEPDTYDGISEEPTLEDSELVWMERVVEEERCYERGYN